VPFVGVTVAAPVDAPLQRMFVALIVDVTAFPEMVWLETLLQPN
jgi:hypothetical protein